MALWGGRFEKGVDAFTQEFGASLEVDKAMAQQDIAGSRAHAKMLAEQGIISEADQQAIDAGLADISGQIANGDFAWDVNDEDIHMAVEGALTRNIGTPGARLHTGRSRNDQVATDIRLYAKELCSHLMEGNRSLRRVFLDVAEKNMGVVMPGYTHLQHAQPVLFSHHMLAYFWMFTRDYTRLAAACDAADANPLGAAALAGTTYPLDRQRTTELLGFIMPQKKNPDFAELTRGKCGRVYGDLMALLTTMKSLPLAYNKDLQECKEGPMDAAKTLSDCMEIAAGMLETMQVNADVMLKQAKLGFTAATDVADYLAKKGMPFRDAHRVVGELVLYCEKHGKGLEDLTADEFRAASDLFGDDIAADLDPEGIANARTTYGGTGIEAVKQQLAEAKAAL